MRNSSECRICCFSSSVSSLGGAFYSREIVREAKGTIENCCGEIPSVKEFAYLGRDNAQESKPSFIRIIDCSPKVVWGIMILPGLYNKAVP